MNDIVDLDFSTECACECGKKYRIEITRLCAERDKMRGLLLRSRTILANMAAENEGAIFWRWKISDEPLRNDAKNLLPLIETALAHAPAPAGTPNDASASSFSVHCTALADHDTQGALAGEVPDIGKENARLHAEMDTARKLLREGTNSGSHYFVTSDWTAAVDSFLADAPVPAERGSEWRNIESAPKDQTILVYASPREDLKGFQSTCKWHDDAGFCVDQLREVTHWMPLPPPPTPSDAEIETGFKEAVARGDLCPKCGSGPHDDWYNCQDDGNDCPGMFIGKPSPSDAGGE